MINLQIWLINILLKVITHTVIDFVQLHSLLLISLIREGVKEHEMLLLVLNKKGDENDFMIICCEKISILFVRDICA